MKDFKVGDLVTNENIICLLDLKIGIILSTTTVTENVSPQQLCVVYWDDGGKRARMSWSLKKVEVE